MSPTQQLWTPNSLDSALEPPSLMSSMTGVSMSGMGGSSGSYSAASAYAVPVSQPCMASEPASNFTIQTPFSSGVIPEEQLHGGMDFMDNLFPLLVSFVFIVALVFQMLTPRARIRAAGSTI